MIFLRNISSIEPEWTAAEPSQTGAHLRAIRGQCRRYVAKGSLHVGGRGHVFVCSCVAPNWMQHLAQVPAIEGMSRARHSVGEHLSETEVDPLLWCYDVLCFFEKSYQMVSLGKPSLYMIHALGLTTTAESRSIATCHHGTSRCCVGRPWSRVMETKNRDLDIKKERGL